MIKLAIFDMDGTIFESHLNWVEIKKHLQVKANILKEINYGDPENVNREKLALLEKYEWENTLKTRPIKGIGGFLNFLKARQIHSVLLTNNNRDNTRYLLEKYNLASLFDYFLTRESGMHKPDQRPFQHLFEKYKCQPAEVISIGDSHYDIIASRQSGVRQVYIIQSLKSDHLIIEYPDIALFEDYHQLKALIEPTLFNN